MPRDPEARETHQQAARSGL
jgi:hypothetical protein